MNETTTVELCENCRSVPIALIALETAEPIDVTVGRFAGHIELNYWGARCVPWRIAMEHLARQWEWRQRHAEENRQVPRSWLRRSPRSRPECRHRKA